MSNTADITREQEFDPARYVFSTAAEPTPIKARTVLPARRENFTVTTADGKRLVGELALPEGEVKATLVTFHPLPTHGGYMDSHVYKKASFRLPALSNIAVLRFNTRGTSSIAAPAKASLTAALPRKEGLRRNPEVRTRARPAEPLAGRLVLRHRAGAQVRARIRERVHRRYSALPRRCTVCTRLSWTSGTKSRTRCTRWCPSMTTTCSLRQRVSVSRLYRALG